MDLVDVRERALRQAVSLANARIAAGDKVRADIVVANAREFAKYLVEPERPATPVAETTG